MNPVTMAKYILCAALFCGTPQLYAAEQGSQTSTDAQPAKEDKDTTAGDKQAKGKDTRDSNQEIFRPSEEISEDFAVSFPVDI